MCLIREKPHHFPLPSISPDIIFLARSWNLHSPLNDPSLPDLKRQRLPTIVARIELRPIRREGAAVVHGDGVAEPRLALAVGWWGGQDLDFWAGAGCHGEDCGQEDGGEEGGKAHLGIGKEGGWEGCWGFSDVWIRSVGHKGGGKYGVFSFKSRRVESLWGVRGLA